MLITECVGILLSLVSLVPRRHGFEERRVRKDEFEGRDGNRMAALPGGMVKPPARWEKMCSEGRDLSDMLASWETDVAPSSGWPRASILNRRFR